MECHTAREAHYFDFRLLMSCCADDEFLLTSGSLVVCAQAHMTRAHLLQVRWTRHIGRAHIPEASCLLLGTCLKIPSCGHKAPPVRRRRSSGGVRVIRVPHVWWQSAAHLVELLRGETCCWPWVPALLAWWGSE